MDLHLKNKIALVTGASRGLGFAAARQIAEEGARLAINSRGEEGLKKAAQEIAAQTQAEVLPIPGDMSSPEFPPRLVAEVVKAYGGLDIIIANAGGPPAGPFESFDDAAWQKAIDLTFLSQVRLIRAALPYLKKSSAAAVLTLTSYSVKQPIPNLVLSNSVRAATVGLTKSLALELGEFGIRFNSILPAWMETDRIVDLMKSRAENKGTSVAEEIRAQAQNSVFGRMGKPQEFADVATFLVSPRAAYITGVMLTVDGGMYKGTF